MSEASRLEVARLGGLLKKQQTVTLVVAVVAAAGWLAFLIK